ncbi:MAG: 50S ribosomal protein L29 [Candidatus Peregrinibacteria bacterium]
MKATELKKLDQKKLLEKLHEAQKELFKAKFETASNQSKNHHLIRKNRKLVARIKTIQTEPKKTNK